MLSVLDIIKYLKGLGITVPLYPIEIPLTVRNIAGIVSLEGGTQEKAGIYEVQLEVSFRGTHPREVEEQSMKVIKLLNNKTNVVLKEGVQIVLINAVPPMPISVGKDEGNNYLYNNNFRLIVNHIKGRDINE